MKLGATRVTTAAVSTVSRRTGSAEPVTHSARVVGMPSACIASEHEELADRRAQHRAAVAHARVGREAAALELQLLRARAALDLAQQQRAAVAELAGPDAELVAAVDAGQRRLPAGHGALPANTSKRLRRCATSSADAEFARRSASLRATQYGSGSGCAGSAV